METGNCEETVDITLNIKVHDYLPAATAKELAELGVRYAESVAVKESNLQELMQTAKTQATLNKRFKSLIKSVNGGKVNDTLAFRYMASALYNACTLTMDSLVGGLSIIGWAITNE